MVDSKKPGLKQYVQYAPYAAWTIALLSTLISLYLSDVLHFPPCILCWYQRIFMYPLAIILFVGILRKDKGIAAYVLPMSLVGIAIATFHTLLQWQIIPDKLAPCSQGISCTTKFINFFGFVTIPFLSLIAFTGITICMVAYWRFGRE